MAPEFISRINWRLLAEQKEWLLNDGSDEAMGLAHLIDDIQDYAVDELGVDEDLVFNNINETKKKDAEELRSAADIKEHNQKILGLIARKQENELEGKSV